MRLLKVNLRPPIELEFDPLPSLRRRVAHDVLQFHAGAFQAAHAARDGGWRLGASFGC